MMIQINIHNYEAFFLDYIEERLTPQQTDALLLFLKSNPHLRDELYEINKFVVHPNNNIFFSGKEQLKQIAIKPAGGLNASNYELAFAAATENDHLPDQKKQLGDFLKANPELKSAYYMMKQCILKPDKDVVYPDKAILKRRTVFQLSNWRKQISIIAVAASLALLAGIYLILQPDRTIEHQIANQPVEPLNQTTENVVVNELPDIKVTIDEYDAIKAEQVTQTQQIDLSLKQLAETVVHDESMMIARRMGEIATIEPLSAAKVLLIPAITLHLDTRNEMSIYFNDVMLAQGIRHNELPEEKGTIRMLAFGGSILRNIFNPGETYSQPVLSKINWWELVDAGVSGFAFLASSDVDFRKQTDETGRLEAIALDVRSLSISHTMPGREK